MGSVPAPRQLLEACPRLPGPSGSVQGDDVRPAARQRGAAAAHGAAVALAQRAGGDDAADAAGGRADGTAVRRPQHGTQGVDVEEVAGGAPVLEEVAESVLLVQGGDDRGAVVLPREGGGKSQEGKGGKKNKKKKKGKRNQKELT